MTKVVKAHEPPPRAPIDLRAGEAVIIGRRDDEWPAFLLCRSPAGEGWIPEEYLDTRSDPARMKRDYTTRELHAVPEDSVTVLERCGSWAFCDVGGGIRGWIPERCLAG